MPQLISERRIAVALRLIDSFTGQIPKGAGMYVRMADGALPVKKENGFYIFWDNGAGKRKLVVRGDGYEPEEIDLDMEALRAKTQPTFCLWLKPDRRYAYPPGITLEETAGHPGEVKEFVIEASTGCLRLAAPYFMAKPDFAGKLDSTAKPDFAGESDSMGKPDSIGKPDSCLIHFLVPDEMELENRRLYIRDKNGAGEYMTVRAVKDKVMGIYQLAGPLEHNYGPYESELLLTMALKADQEGRFLIPLHTSAVSG